MKSKMDYVTEFDDGTRRIDSAYYGRDLSYREWCALEVQRINADPDRRVALDTNAGGYIAIKNLLPVPARRMRGDGKWVL